jgi:hypothetical protein
VSDVLLRASCELSFEVVIPTPMVFMLRPRSSPTQWVAAEEYHLSPSLRVVEFADGFGNLCQRLVAPVFTLEHRLRCKYQKHSRSRAIPDL